ncbi:MAG: hypothetical protein ACR2G0_13490 [Chthoniobacterales bacterium]
MTLFAVNDGTKTSDVTIPMSVLIGDNTANGTVNSADVSQTKAQPGTIKQFQFPRRRGGERLDQQRRRWSSEA